MDAHNSPVDLVARIADASDHAFFTQLLEAIRDTIDDDWFGSLYDVTRFVLLSMHSMTAAKKNAAIAAITQWVGERMAADLAVIKGMAMDDPTDGVVDETLENMWAARFNGFVTESDWRWAYYGENDKLISLFESMGIPVSADLTYEVIEHTEGATRNDVFSLMRTFDKGMYIAYFTDKAIRIAATMSIPEPDPLSGKASPEWMALEFFTETKRLNYDMPDDMIGEYREHLNTLRAWVQ